MILRPYQVKALDELRQALRTHRSALLCQPCGSGKGSICAYMVNEAVKRGKRVIFAVAGRSLCVDMSERVTKLGIEHGVLMGGRQRQTWHPVQVASIDTLHRMAVKPVADLLILDEARSFMSDTRRKVIDDMPNAKIVGLDATPARLDGKGLSGIFDVMVMGPSEQDLIDLGYLVPSIPIGVPIPIDVSKVGKTGGDFNQKALAEVCDTDKLIGDIVEHWLREAPDRKTVAFGVDQAHAKHITERFVAAGIEWEYVDATTPDEERAAIWDRLDNGTLMGVSNCGICLVGWDHPIVSCLIMARPTASLSLWRQMMGRGSRLYPGKTDFKIICHAGNFTRPELYPWSFFETPPVWSLEGCVKSISDDGPKPPPIATCKVPMLVPETGVPSFFTGPLSPDGKYMLPSYHHFRSGPVICPYCGIPLKIAGREIETEAGDLKDLSALREAAKAEIRKSDKQLAHESKLRLRYIELAKVAATTRKRDGTPYKPGWAAISFHAETGRWPVKAWKDEALQLLERSDR